MASSVGGATAVVGSDSSLFEDVFSYNNLVHAIAGATGSVVAMSTFYPLDIVRTRLQADDNLKAVGPVQAMKKISDEEGVEALYRGLGPVLASLYCSNFVYFYTFSGMKAVAASNGIKGSAPRDLLLGYLSGCVNALVTTPLWVVNTRLKLKGALKDSNDNPSDKIDTLLDGLRKIPQKEGIGALWNGVEASFILSGNPAIHFMVYEGLKRMFVRSKRANGQKLTLSSFESFVIGGFAKAVATVITYPLQLVQCRLRAKRRSKKDGATMKCIFEEVIGQSGYLGLYKGMESKLYQTVLTSALMFLTYEKIVRLIYRLFKVHQGKRWYAHAQTKRK